MKIKLVTLLAITGLPLCSFAHNQDIDRDIDRDDRVKSHWGPGFLFERGGDRNDDRRLSTEHKRVLVDLLDRLDTDKGSGGCRIGGQQTPPIVMTPEADPVWILVPVVGAMVVLSSWQLRRRV